MTATPSQRARLAYETWRDTPADGESQWPKWLAVKAALRLPAGEAAPSELRHFAKRNLRNLIELGSTDKALMLSNLEELS